MRELLTVIIFSVVALGIFLIFVAAGWPGTPDVCLVQKSLWGFPSDCYMRIFRSQGRSARPACASPSTPGRTSWASSSGAIVAWGRVRVRNGFNAGAFSGRMRGRRLLSDHLHLRRDLPRSRQHVVPRLDDPLGKRLRPVVDVPVRQLHRRLHLRAARARGMGLAGRPCLSRRDGRAHHPGLGDGGEFGARHPAADRRGCGARDRQRGAPTPSAMPTRSAISS